MADDAASAMTAMRTGLMDRAFEAVKRVTIAVDANLEPLVVVVPQTSHLAIESSFPDTRSHAQSTAIECRELSASNLRSRHPDQMCIEVMYNSSARLPRMSVAAFG